MHERTLQLPSCLIVANANFVPRGPNGPFPYGGAYFVAELARELATLDSFSGFLLYQREEALAEPLLEEETLWGWPAYRLRFNFNHPPVSIAHLVSGLLRRAAARLKPRRRVGLYHQTGALLPFVGDAPGVVTHHGPFVRDVVGLLGREIAVDAFGGGPQKLDALSSLQESGLNHFVRSQHLRALEISSVQSQSLLENGVSPHRLTTAAPLIRVPEASNFAPPAEVTDFLARNPGHLVVLTAVARIDAFKNIELLVDAVATLRASDHPAACIVIGGPLNDERSRHQLLERIPSDVRASFLVLPRLPRDDLHSVFRAVKDTGLFVCPSRFETLGITGLEAMCCGLPVSVTDLPRWIGLADFVPAAFRFQPTVASLSELLASVMANPRTLAGAKTAATETRAKITGGGFRKALVRNLELLPVPPK